jgi:hypothetical protein
VSGLRTVQTPVPEVDVKAGMEVYLTRSRGLGGKIRQNVEDFKVDEVYDNRDTPRSARLVAALRHQPEEDKLGGDEGQKSCYDSKDEHL